MQLQLLILALFSICCLLTSVKARRRHVSTTGYVMCRVAGIDRPLPYVTVKLRDDDVLIDDTFGTTRSSSTGYFQVSGEAGDTFGKPDPYIQVEYEYSGTYGQMEVENVLGINYKERIPKRGYSSSINFGNIVFDSRECRAYYRIWQAMKNYRDRTGLSLPYTKLKVHPKGLFATHARRHSIWINRNENYLSETTAQHELAHTVRHTLDGNDLHFGYDVVRFGYTRYHSCSDETNEGYAFNEGWAEFWANSCHGTYGTSTNYEIEGNVAKALRSLKSKCSRGDRYMVEVLRRNPGRIHSFGEYNGYFGRLYGCSL